MRIYLDACVVIYLIEEHPTLHPRIDAAIRADPDLRLVLSDLTRMECRVGPLKRQDRELLFRFDRFFANPEHQYVAASRELFDLAAELRARSGIKTPDALHLATAIQGGCNEFWTGDRRLESWAPGHIRVVVFA